MYDGLFRELYRGTRSNFHTNFNRDRLRDDSEASDPA